MPFYFVISVLLVYIHLDAIDLDWSAHHAMHCFAGLPCIALGIRCNPRTDESFKCVCVIFLKEDLVGLLHTCQIIK